MHAFLTETKIFVKVGTIGEDGWPNVNPAWYEYDGESFWLVTKALAGFCQNMRRDPRVTLCIDNPEPPYKRVMVRGPAEFVDDDWVELARRMVLRYLGPEGIDYFEATLDLPRVLVRIRPERHLELERRRRRPDVHEAAGLARRARRAAVEEAAAS